MISTYIPYITNKEKQSLSSSLNSNFVSTAGPKINEFEKLFNKIFKFKYSVALNSGTSALHLALLASGVQKDDLGLRYLQQCLYSSSKTIFSYD